MACGWEIYPHFPCARTRDMHMHAHWSTQLYAAMHTPHTPNYSSHDTRTHGPPHVYTHKEFTR